MGHVQVMFNAQHFFLCWGGGRSSTGGYCGVITVGVVEWLLLASCEVISSPSVSWVLLFQKNSLTAANASYWLHVLVLGDDPLLQLLRQLVVAVEFLGLSELLSLMVVGTVVVLSIAVTSTVQLHGWLLFSLLASLTWVLFSCWPIITSVIYIGLYG